MAEFDLRTLYAKVFGYRAIPFPELAAENGFDTLATDPFGIVDSLRGSPRVIAPLTINGYEMPNEPLIELGRRKSIVRNEITGGVGSIKEDMGIEDWEITIRGIIVNEDAIDETFDDVPQGIIRNIKALGDVRGALEVVSPILELYDINYIAIERMRFPESQGSLNMQPYIITALSDNDPEEEFNRLNNNEEG